MPYDVEFTFGAALHLSIANTLFPDVTDYPGCGELAHQILDNLISRGNRVAASRKAELLHLENLCQELVAEIQEQGHETLQLLLNQNGTLSELVSRSNEEHERLITMTSDTSTLGEVDDRGHTLNNTHPQMTSNVEFLDDIGISSEEFLSIVQQMGDLETHPENILTLG